jgi:prolyl 4-hydroxylase
MQAEAPYCGLGFSKARLDPHIQRRIREHFEANAERFRPEIEIEHIRNDDPSIIPALYFEEPSFNDWLGQELRPRHEDWCGMRLEGTACYGIRVYQRGTFLYNHVDRMATHVISSTICVDHRLSGPWPLHIEDIDGRPSQINIEPGELVFYEGARLKHGRPYPLAGDYYASIFVHYRPVDWPLSVPGAP